MDILKYGGIKTKLKYIILIFLLIMPASASFNPIRPNKEAWTCYDYALNFSESNPDWGIVTISDHPRFYVSHVVNYQQVDNNTLRIHDGMYECDYMFSGWKNSGYYHFWPGNCTPRRYFIRLLDNRYLLTNETRI